MIGDLMKIKSHWGDVEQYLAQHGITKQNAWQNKGKVFELLKSLNIDESTVKKALPWGKGLYKVGKNFLPEQHRNYDIDKMEHEIKKIFKIEDGAPSYDYRRASNTYELDGIGYSKRSSTLPD